MKTQTHLLDVAHSPLGGPYRVRCRCGWEDDKLRKTWAAVLKSMKQHLMEVEP